MMDYLLSEDALSFYSAAGLIVFLAFFVGVIIWTLTRSRKQANNWASIPLDKDDATPRTPRDQPPTD